MATVLWEEGTSGTEALPAEPGQGALLAYFEDGAGLEERLARQLGPLEARVLPTAVPDVDWVERFRQGFRPFRVGAFRIVPAWKATSAVVAGEARLLVVEPGVAFGTGTHETTRLCLAALEECAASGPLGDVADVGCGSAILGLAALRLGARRAVGVEIDCEALPVALGHVRLNDLPMSLVRGDGGRPLRSGAFDVVVANLTAGLLAERRFELSALRRRGEGVLLLSGLLATEAVGLADAYSPFGSVEARTLGEWALLRVR